MQTLVKYGPWSLLRDVQEDVGHLLDKNFLLRDRQNDPSEVATSQWSPRVDIHEETDKFVLLADLPGVEPKEIEVSMENNILTIKGQRTVERKMEEGNYSRVERFSGTFYRRFTLPDSVQGEKIQARGKNGVLEIIVPKKERNVPKKIQVQVEE